MYIFAALATLSLAASAPLEPRQSPANTTSLGPCASLGNGTVFLPTAIKECLQSVPFSRNVQRNIMDAVTALYTLDIFQYNQLGDSDPVLNQGVDIDSGFQRINSTKYNSDFDFQQDLSKVMNSLNDGHHIWESCYSTTFKTRHFLPIIAARPENSSQTNIYFTPDLLTFVPKSVAAIYNETGINVTSLPGSQITKIEGLDVWDHLTNVSVPLAGTYQDPEQRLNHLFTSYQGDQGVFTKSLGQFTFTNSFDQANITIQAKGTDGQSMKVVVPWLTSYSGDVPLGSFANGTALFETLCLPQATNTTTSTNSTSTQSSSTSSSTGASNSTSTSLADLAQELYAACPIDITTATSSINSPMNTSAYLGGRDIQFYLMSDNQTGVIFVPTFSADLGTDTSTDDCTFRWAYDAYAGLQNFTLAGVNRILIDTSNNGGGAVFLTQWLQRLLTGKQFLLENNFQSVLRKSPLSQALLNQHIALTNETMGGTYDPSLFRNGTTQDLPSTDNIFSPGQSRHINNHTLYTSDLISDSLDQILSYDQMFNISDDAPFAPMDIVFTGNGLCGSSCSSFTNFLIEYYNATAYIAAARPELPIEFQAFAAGQASTSTAIYQEAAQLNFENATLLPPLEVVGILGIAVRAAISPNIDPGQFLQYRTYPAQQRYSLSPEQYLDPLANWEYVASQAFTN